MNPIRTFQLAGRTGNNIINSSKTSDWPCCVKQENALTAIRERINRLAFAFGANWASRDN